MNSFFCKRVNGSDYADVPWIVCVPAPLSPGVDHFNLAGIDFSRHMRSRKYILGRCFIPPQWFYKLCVGYCLTKRSTIKNAEEQYFYRDNIENTYGSIIL